MEFCCVVLRCTETEDGVPNHSHLHCTMIRRGLSLVLLCVVLGSFETEDGVMRSRDVAAVQCLEWTFELEVMHTLIAMCAPSFGLIAAGPVHMAWVSNSWNWPEILQIMIRGMKASTFRAQLHTTLQSTRPLQALLVRQCAKAQFSVEVLSSTIR